MNVSLTQECIVTKLCHFFALGQLGMACYTTTVQASILSAQKLKYSFKVLNDDFIMSEIQQLIALTC